MRVGVVACGYADGYPRHAPTGTPVLVDGQRSRTVGRVSMDMLCVDLSDIPDAGVGTPVTCGARACRWRSRRGGRHRQLRTAVRLAPRVPVVEV